MTGQWVRRPLVAGAVAVCCIALMGADKGKGHGDDSIPLTVPKATCGPNDHPETGLQGQVPAALRATGFKGFNCNLELNGQSRGDGANWQTTEFTSGHGRKAKTCAYHGTASPALSMPGRAHLGVPVIDITQPANPTPTPTHPDTPTAKMREIPHPCLTNDSP